MAKQSTKGLSGKFVLRLPTELHAQLRDRAFKRGISLNQICIQLIEAGISNGLDESCSGPLKQIETAARKKYRDNFLGMILFGSVARGEARDGSDTDILIVLSSEIPIVRSLYEDWNMELENNISVHLTHLPRNAEEAGSLWLECALDGKLLYDKHGGISRILTKIKERITSGKIIRKITHGQGYWVPV